MAESCATMFTDVQLICRTRDYLCAAVSAAMCPISVGSVPTLGTRSATRQNGQYDVVHFFVGATGPAPAVRRDRALNQL
jgi:hypothetical protein